MTNQQTLSIPADVGAGWIHQGIGNPVTDLANQYNVAWKEVNLDNNQLYDMNGAPVSLTVPDALYQQECSYIRRPYSLLHDDDDCINTLQFY